MACAERWLEIWTGSRRTGAASVALCIGLLGGALLGCKGSAEEERSKAPDPAAPSPGASAAPSASASAAATSRPWSNGKGPEMLPVPAGVVSLSGGAPVNVAAFHLDKTEVTVAQYRQCVEAKQCTVVGLDCPNGNWPEAARGDHPINCVRFKQADAFCTWAEKRLPTEAEWEHAARGPARLQYPWGNEAPDKQACWDPNANDESKAQRKSTCAVGSSAGDASPFGILDMAGNVREWTSSLYLPEKPGLRVTRGSCWACDKPSEQAGAARDSMREQDYFGSVGFRCARDG